MPVLRLEVAGVAGEHPLAVQRLPRGGLVLVVAGKAVAAARGNFADALLVGVANLHLHALEGHAHAVKIHLAGRVQRVGADQFGLPVELPQRHAHGQKEAKSLGAERRAAGGGRSQPRKPQPILERAEQQPVRRARNAPLHNRPHTEAQPKLKDPLLQPRGVHHARAHLRGELLPGAGREQQQGGAELAHIVHGRLGFLGEVHAHAAEQRQAHRIDLLNNPWQRLHRDILVARAARVVAQIGGAVLDKAPRLQHGELRVRSGARGGAENRHLFARSRIQHTRISARIVAPLRLAQAQQFFHGEQPLVAILAHAARIAVNNVPQRIRARAELQQLVHLLLVFGQHHGGGGVVEQISHLVVQRVAVNAETHCAQRMGGDFAAEPIRPIVSNQRHGVAALHAQRVQPQRNALDPRLVFGPTGLMPNAQALFAVGNLRPVLPGVARQQPGKSIEPLALHRRAHAAAPSSPRYAARTAGSAIISAGAPSAILRPKSSTTTRCEISITTPISCSIISTAMPHSSFNSTM